MDINLILSAQTLSLAPRLSRSELTNGLFVVKNEPAMTYLTVTPEQWFILQQFEAPRIVPAVLADAIRDRHCLPLAEFYELILKALRANVLLEAGANPKPVEAHPWKWSVRPSVAGRPLLVLFCAGFLVALFYAPRLPVNILDAVVSAALLVVAASFGAFLAGCLVRGGGGEVYQPRWKWAAFPPHFTVATNDEAMLPTRARAMIALATPAALAAATGIAAWHRPDWAFFPLLGLGLEPAARPGRPLRRDHPLGLGPRAERCGARLSFSPEPPARGAAQAPPEGPQPVNQLGARLLRHRMDVRGPLLGRVAAQRAPLEPRFLEGQRIPNRRRCRRTAGRPGPRLRRMGGLPLDTRARAGAPQHDPPLADALVRWHPRHARRGCAREGPLILAADRHVKAQREA